nr:uncharacterized protein CI109_000226 [Kwoniella shandongensis]KAA5531385.1 hypothetical protein CI109_000226 [Kwoniella shandongensis]
MGGSGVKNGNLRTAREIQQDYMEAGIWGLTYLTGLFATRDDFPQDDRLLSEHSQWSFGR